MDLISPQQAGTLDGLFRARVRSSPDRIAYLSHDGQGWTGTSWADTARQVARWQAGLRAAGLVSGDRVGLLLRNCREWVEFEQAALGLGLVVVPLYVEDRAENSAYVIAHAGIRLLLIQDERHWRRLSGAIGDDYGWLERVVLLNGEPEAGDPRARRCAEWLPAEGGELPEREGEPEALATIVYTSGTTGRPKGVMLSHRNILENAFAAATMGQRYFSGEDLFLSFLPLSHTLERTAGYYLPMMLGAGIAYARSVQQLADDMKTVQPSVLVAVPRLFERIYGKIEGQLAEKRPLAQKLFRRTLATGWHRFEQRQQRAAWGPDLLLWPLLARLVAHKIKAGFGGRLRIAISGGAALSPGVARFFLGLDLPLLQGYGLTETSPVVSCNLPEHNDPASVGPALPGIEVRTGEDNELLVRGPNVCLGYWKDPEATARLIDGDGWLHTGDQARIQDGHIYITGRLKDILVLSNGEKVPPVDIEAALTLDPLVDHAVVLGEGQAYLGALLVLNPDEWRRYAAGAGLDPAAAASLADRSLHKQLLARLAPRLAQFPGYARVRRLALTLEPWSVENGLLTPTLKLRRARIAEHYGREIAALFE